MANIMIKTNKLSKLTPLKKNSGAAIVLNMHIKFRSNRMLFIIRLINLFFIHNFRSQKLEILRFL